MSNALSVKNLNVSYLGNVALTNVSFQVDEGALVGIIGPNGAGKSTLIKAMMGLIPSETGKVEILGKPIRKIRKKIAYVPQRNDIDWDFPIHVIDAVMIGTYPHLGLFKRPKKQEREWAYQCLERVGMQDYSKRQIGELSGGQQQRVFLARALAQNADIFFLDEPFVGVDVSSENTIMQILKELQKEGKTTLVVHHDLSKANVYFDELILLNKELIAKGEVTDVLEVNTIQKAYGNPLAFMKNEIGVKQA
ncbi:metal ABC transporter ATP-binding protein [Pseudalkalibacillus salsuginis]|uniref:metal ABC transporter ATP-binding protein n=1 Tax=Pseudalkalibacillus salsuginis TaxID=2910972 RepID=UPI001F2E2B61|nr:metal ABC transporter ATP-binding protein [Pseudalkalibacillus salsuginis]MCF6411258.1 metal ABC transporter ATP-binding protein [Pseudalkalibacillus salsuginis]